MTSRPPGIARDGIRLGTEGLAQLLCFASAAAAAVGAFGFYTRAEWAISIWPWPEVGMTFIWLGSIAAAIVAPLLCIALTREFAALAGLGLNFFLLGAATAAYMGWRMWRWNDPIAAPLFESALFAMVGAAVSAWAWHLPVRDPRPMPTFVRAAFAVFALILVTTGSAVALQTERIFPWNLQPPTSTLIGFIFLGAAAMFVHAILHPRWAFAAAPLWSFLAYDVVLFAPYFRMLSGLSAPASVAFDDYGSEGGAVNMPSLSVFLVVLSISSMIALYALLLHPGTRIVRPRPMATATKP